MSNAGHKYTDEQIDELAEKFEGIYKRASDELEKKASAYFSRFEKQDEQMRKNVEKGLIKQEDYEKWRISQMMTGEHWKMLKEQSAKTLLEANENALKLANGKLPSVYSFTYNEVGKDAEDVIKGYSFDLVNERAVAELAKSDKTLLPYKTLDGKKDERWNTKKVNAEVMQGIIQGESIPKIAKRLASVTEMNKASAIRNARTAMTGAENRGTLDGMIALQDDGVVIEKTWLSAHDARVRDSHAAINGESVPVDEEFGNGLMYPGDPDGVPAEVYNCRCSMITKILGFKSKQTGHYIANGNDISGTWKRRAGEFDFEIEDVINAQGFDGKPKIVSQEEFDELVKQANDGNGFVAQRTYSAPDQETLDAYRDQLYNGKWYVDCSTGGAQYGQGMYCAADYNGKLTDGIRSEMKHYQTLNADKLGSLSVDDLNKIAQVQADHANEILRQYKAGEISRDEGVKLYREIKNMNPNEYLASYMKDSNIVGARAYTETFTLDPSAKIIKYEDLSQMFVNYKNAGMAERIKKIESISKDARETVLSSIADKNERDKYGRLLDSMLSFKTPKMDRQTELKVYDLFDAFQVEKERLSKEIKKMQRYQYDDIGSYAASLGYDAINAEGHGESSSYTVILNRTKLIIKGGK